MVHRPTVEVRPFTEADRADLVALWSLVFPDDPPWNEPAVLIGRKLSVQPELLLVACTGTELVGAVMGGFDGVRGWVHHLAVHPQHRRRKIGQLLMQAVEAGLRRLGCPKVNLQVRATNTAVVAFYRSIGYEIEEWISLGRRLDTPQMPRP